MNDGELKAIVEDFAQVIEATKPKLFDSDTASLAKISRQAERIAGQIVAAKIMNGDYKGQRYYDEML